MLDLLRELTSPNAVSGDEDSVRDFIIKKIDGYCEYRTDPLGNILAFKCGKNRSAKKLMLDAHMDEVGLIITSVTDDGFLKFQTVGGIYASALMFRQVKIGSINGVICGKPIHLVDNEERKKLPEIKNLYIDIGASSKNAALSLVNIGDKATFINEFIVSGSKIKAKALDDRIGCAVLISLLTKESDYDFYASFSVQEEIGTRGAKTAAYTIDPEFALILEATTAADIADVPKEHQVTILGDGPAVSFMDRATMYDRELYKIALDSGIKCQSKNAVTGGNNSGSVHLSRGGVRTLAISAPCRYIHSASCVADIDDIENTLRLTDYMINKICSGNII